MGARARTEWPCKETKSGPSTEGSKLAKPKVVRRSVDEVAAASPPENKEATWQGGLEGVLFKKFSESL